MSYFPVCILRLNFFERLCKSLFSSTSVGSVKTTGILFICFVYPKVRSSAMSEHAFSSLLQYSTMNGSSSVKKVGHHLSIISIKSESFLNKTHRLYSWRLSPKKSTICFWACIEIVPLVITHTWLGLIALFLVVQSYDVSNASFTWLRVLIILFLSFFVPPPSLPTLATTAWFISLPVFSSTSKKTMSFPCSFAPWRTVTPL